MSHPALPDRVDEDVELRDPGLDIALLRRRREIVLTLLTITLVLGAALFTAFRLLRVEPVGPAEFRAIAHQSIRDAFPTGLALQFSSPAETELIELGESSREVAGNVVAVTSNGQARYYRFRCTLSLKSDAHWSLSRLQLTPQW